MAPATRSGNWGGRVENIPIPSNGDDFAESPRPKGQVCRIVLYAILAASLLTYTIVGIVHLARDYIVVHRCHSSTNVHVIWQTSLWTYVLSSLILAGFGSIVLLYLPFGRVVEAFEHQISSRRRRKKNSSAYTMEDEFERMQRRRTRFGVMDELPDWMFLLVGTVMMGLAVVTFIFAMFGYSELYLAHPWCEDKHAAFEELNLWHFGRFTFIVQLCLGILFSIMGVLFWAMPCIFELIDPDIEPVIPDFDMDSERGPVRSPRRVLAGF